MVPLSRLWQLEWEDDAPVDLTKHVGRVLWALIEAAFNNGELEISGLNKNHDRVPLRPLDHEINWIGPPDATDYHPCAVPRGAPLSRPLLLELAVAKADWDRLYNQALWWLIEWANMVRGETRPRPAVEEPRRDVSDRPLKSAPNPSIREAVDAVYGEIKASGGKPPNLNEIIAPVQRYLGEKGYQASGQQIQKIAGKKPHGRLGRGKHWGRELASC
jgi:hypothetical protein